MEQGKARQPEPTSVLRYIAEAQKLGLARTTAYGAFRKAGGRMPAGRFRLLWAAQELNPLQFRGV